MSDSFKTRRSSEPLNPSCGPAQLILFPLCDSRGLVSQSLSANSTVPEQEAQNLFFAWLLDLPAEIDAAAAASAMLLVSGVSEQSDSGGLGPGIQPDRGDFKSTMIGLLEQLVKRDSLYEAPQNPLIEAHLPL